MSQTGAPSLLVRQPVRQGQRAHHHAATLQRHPKIFPSTQSFPADPLASSPLPPSARATKAMWELCRNPYLGTNLGSDLGCTPLFFFFFSAWLISQIRPQRSSANIQYGSSMAHHRLSVGC